VLARGYAWVTDADGRPVLSAQAVTVGQALVAVWHDGRALTEVKQVEPDRQR